MKNTIKGGVVALGILGAVTFGVPWVAHAQVEGDLNDHSGYEYALGLNEDRVPGTALDAINLARTVCTDRAEGISEEDLIKTATSLDGSRGDAVDIVDDAEYHFCPGYETVNGVVPMWIQNPSSPRGWTENPAADALLRGTTAA